MVGYKWRTDLETRLQFIALKFTRVYQLNTLKGAHSSQHTPAAETLPLTRHTQDSSLCIFYRNDFIMQKIIPEMYYVYFKYYNIDKVRVWIHTFVSL